jgi:hypothetical protein
VGAGSDRQGKLFADDVFARFRLECKKAGKKLMVWTVNDPYQMMEVSMFDKNEATT